MPKRNENKLSVIYDKKQRDFVVKYPRKCDERLKEELKSILKPKNGYIEIINS
jgi:hypothetical protein